MKRWIDRERKRAGLLGLVALAPLAAPVAQAEGWEHALSPYLWATGMSGTVAVATPLGPLPADVDMSFSDIWSNLRFGGMVNYEGRKDKWVVLSDAIYMDLRSTGGRSVPGIQTSSRAGVTQLALEVDGGYFITERIALYAGARYNDIDADVRVDVTTILGTNRRSASGGASWVDPVVGLLGHFPIAPRWSVDLKADIGGFGVGSEFAWQVMGGVRWKLNDAWDLTAAYRYMDMDYEDLNGSGIVRYDMTIQGPMLGGTWRF